MGEKNEAVELGPVQQQDSPPSWKEVMNEKEDKAKQEGKFPIADVEAVTVNQAEVSTAMQRLAARLNKTLSILRKIVQRGLILSDLALLLCSLTVLILGYLVLVKHFEVVRVMYTSWVSITGNAMVATSSLNLGFFGPLGLIGVWKTKKSLLKWHNIWLLLNLLIHLVLLYMWIDFLQKSLIVQKQKFKKSFETIYTNCDYMESSNECCCKIDKVDICWKSDQNLKNSLDWDEKNPLKNLEDSQLYRTIRQTCMIDHTDYFGKAMKAMEDDCWCFAGVILVEGFALFFGTVTILTTDYPEPEDDEETPVKVQLKSEKGGLGIFKKVLIFFVVKRLFLFCLAIVFFISYRFLKDAAEATEIEIICSLGFGLMHVQLIEEDNTKKRRKRGQQPKGKFGKIVQKTKYFACRRFLLVVFAFLLFMGLIFWKLAKNEFKVTVAGIKGVNVFELIWDMLKYTFGNDEAAQGNLV